MTGPLTAEGSHTLAEASRPLTNRVAYTTGQRYDELFPQSQQWAESCLTIVNRYAGKPIRSVLDIGCGTGHALALFAQSADECWGIDALPAMVAASKARCATAVVGAADMRTLDLGRRFEVLISLGSTFIHALTNTDVAKTLQTMAAHTVPGGLLVLEMLSGPGILTGAVRAENLNVGLEGGPMHAVSTIEIDRAGSLLHLTRTWYSHGEPGATEHSVHRLMMPPEIEAWLNWAGFSLIALADNAELMPSDLRGQRLWVVARRDPSPTPVG